MSWRFRVSKRLECKVGKWNWNTFRIVFKSNIENFGYFPDFDQKTYSQTKRDHKVGFVIKDVQQNNQMLENSK